MRSFLFAIAVALTVVAPAAGQLRGGGNPYSSQLRTDPALGTIQAIQRYGRPLSTDPAEGDGYPYFVFPSLGTSGVGRNALTRQQSLAITGRLQFVTNQLALLNSRLDVATTLDRESLQRQQASLVQEQAALTAIIRRQPPSNESDAPLSLTAGLRSPLGSEALDLRLLTAGAFNNTEDIDPLKLLEIHHQPLIQIKLRVIEVIRNDALGASSTLDYIRNHPGVDSLIGGRGINNINAGDRNLSTTTRFDDGRLGLLGIGNTVGTMGLALLDQTNAGALVNLTSEHLNLVAKFLAIELSADVITAPELLTTNGENVEFTSGGKLPFRLGTATDGEGVTVNHFFYKHVGTFVSVTPRIVNFGVFGRGNGDASIVASDIRDWNLLIRFMIQERLTWSEGVRMPEQESHPWEPYTRLGRLVPLEIQEEVLDELNQYTKSDLRAFIFERLESDPDFPFHFLDIFHDPCGDCGPGGCQWRPEDCTIDLEIVARFSEEGTISNAIVPTSEDTDLTIEDEVRAVANVLQVKSGKGVVMAGLIGEREIEDIQKTPVFGDIPIVALFDPREWCE